MSIPITIFGTTVNFPSSGQSPNWAPAVIEFAQLVEAALSIAVGPYDIPSQTYEIIADSNTNVDLPNLSFPTSNVHGAIIRYAALRTYGDIDPVSETGVIIVNYNSSAPVGEKWQISREYVGGDSSNDGLGARITFAISDVGQVSFSSVPLGGTTPEGNIIYTATALNV